MATPFTLSGELLLPVDPGQPNSSAPFSVVDNFESRVDYELNYTGSSTEILSLGTMPAAGAKAIVLELEFGATVAPINLRFNGGGSSGQVEVSPGGFFVLASPVPAIGVTAISIVHTTAVKIRLRILG